jgi:para-aminobenzoate synthetase component I
VAKSMIHQIEFLGQPREVFARLRHRDAASLLESADSNGWSYIACDSALTLETRGELTVLLEHNETIETWNNPFSALEILFERFKSKLEPRPNGMNFAGGWIGFLGYDLVRFLEDIPSLAPSLAGEDLRLHLVDFVLAFDHANQTWYSSSMTLERRENRTAIWAEILASARSNGVFQDSFCSGKLEPLTKPETYLEDIERCLEYIRAGDIFQVNLTHRLEADFSGDPFALYRALMLGNPAPFAAFLSGDVTVVSASPERFVKRTGNRLEARPIKGTRARGSTPAEDEIQRQMLERSLKDHSENLMIVDLMRNDLGRVAVFGSVKTPELFALEPHGAVWQMISTISAELKPKLSSLEVLLATFPPGSMTGAPKVRAMQIIEELEPVRRGVYSGVIGYFDLNGDFDLSVVIRSAIVKNGKIQIQAGGAIVADSIPQLELEETHAKTLALRTVLNQGKHETTIF